MGFLPDYTNGIEHKHLTNDLIEFIRTTVLSNSSQFISKDRSLRLRWIKFDVGFLIPISWEGGLLKSIGSWLIDSIFFGIFRKNLIDNIDSYRKLGKLAFSKKNEVLFEATLKNRINWCVLRWADKYAKWRLKKMHNQEETRRQKSSFETTITQITTPISLEEAVLLNYETLKLFSVTEFIYISHWEHKQTEFLVKRIDRTFQRFIPCKKMSVKEVMGRLHDKIDELAKEIDAKERIDRKSRDTMENQITLFQTKIELEFYNHLNKNIDSLYEKWAEESGKPDDVGFMRRQSLMMFYLLKHGQLIDKADNTKYARFIRYLTGKSYDNIRKNWNNVRFKVRDKDRKEDLEDILKYFKAIRAEQIIKMIENDIAFANKFKTKKMNGRDDNQDMLE